MARQAVRDLLAARRLFRLCALPMGHKASWDESLDRYRQAIAQTGKTMHYLGVAAACEHCALKAGGSCCFSGVENKYDKALGEPRQIKFAATDHLRVGSNLGQVQPLGCLWAVKTTPSFTMRSLAISSEISKGDPEASTTACT